MKAKTGPSDKASKYPHSVSGILALKHFPVVAIDESGLFTFVNNMFEQTYGWAAKELLGQSVTKIMPPYMRDAHRVGFARYLTTEHATLLGKPLELTVLHKGGRVSGTEHYILGEKRNGAWRFAAIIAAREA